jgi:hypothetical protein
LCVSVTKSRLSHVVSEIDNSFFGKRVCLQIAVEGKNGFSKHWKICSGLLRKIEARFIPQLKHPSSEPLGAPLEQIKIEALFNCRAGDLTGYGGSGDPPYVRL